MPGSKEIRAKIKSVENTRKITRAMEMVAASKMRKAQDRMRAGRPYAEKIRNVAAHLSRANPEYKHPFLVKRDNVKNVGIIVVTSDKGLCGGLNTNVLRVVVGRMKEWEGEGKGIRVCPIGNKGYFDDVEVKKALAFESALHAFLKSKHKPLMDAIESSKDLSGDNEKALAAAIESFKATAVY